MELLKTIPTIDNVENPNLNQVIAFIFQGSSLNKEDFKNTCLNLSANEAKKLHEQIIEIKKINALKKALDNNTVNFDKINLNIVKNYKERLKKIIEQKGIENLRAFLGEHEKMVSINQGFLTDLINSIKIIDTKQHKILLREFVEKGVGKITKDEFNKIVNVVFKNDYNSRKLWKMSYKTLIKKRINSLKRYQIVQLDYTINF